MLVLLRVSDAESRLVVDSTFNDVAVGLASGINDSPNSYGSVHSRSKGGALLNGEILELATS